MIKVSIIIPVFNMANYLAECLDSVTGQTLAEKEIICINDGSTDDSLLILKQYQQNHDNIVIIDQENIGVAKTRNKGIKIAKGEFAAFMDPDDYYPENDILECLYNSAKENNVCICGGSGAFLVNNVVKEDFENIIRGLTFKQNQKIEYKDYQFQYLYTRFIYQLKMIKTNALYFPLYIRYQDPPFMVKAMLCAGEFYGISKITYCYRTGYKNSFSFVRADIIKDVLKGFLDLLVMSNDEKMPRLHAHVVHDIHNDYSGCFLNGALTGNEDIKSLITNINDKISKELLREANSPYQSSPYFDYDKPHKLRENLVAKIVEFKKYPHIFIYGAGFIGKSITKFISIETDIKINGFVVTTKSNDEVIRGLSLKEIAEVSDFYDSALFLISVMPELKNEIVQIITGHGIMNYYVFDNQEIEFFRDYQGCGTNVQ